jgi:hypothetical protein
MSQSKIDRQREERRAKVASGLCRIKGCPNEIFLASSCERHWHLKLIVDRKARIKIKLRRKENNQCQWCGLDLSRCDREGMSICASCAEQKSQYNHLRREGY